MRTEELLEVEAARREANEQRTEPEWAAYYKTIRDAGFPLGEVAKFTYDIAQGHALEYHYALICEDLARPAPSRLHIDQQFYRHDEAGIEFLLKKCADDVRHRHEAAYLIASTLNNCRHRDFYRSCCAKLIPVLKELLASSDSSRREKAIIALGWVGTAKEIPDLCSCLINDPDKRCRAWSATGLMQMSFHRVSRKTVCKQAAGSLASSIAQENDLFALGCMIETIQTLWDKNWISSTAVEDRNEARILKARKTAQRFLQRQGIV